MLESRKTFWVLFLVCIGIRMYLFFNTFVISKDSFLYIAMADAFFESRFLEALKYVTPPVYPLLLAGMKLIIRDSEIAGKLVSFLAGTFTFFPLYYLGKRIFDQRVALIGLLFFSVHPYLVRYSAEVLSESTFIFLGVTGLWMLWKGWEEKKYFYSCFSGILLGLSCLTRAQGFIWIGVILAVPLFFSLLGQRNEMDKRKIWTFSLIAALVFFLIISPYVYFLKGLTGEWTVRQQGASAIVQGTGYSGNHGLWGAVIALLSHPWLLLKKLGWNMGRLSLLLPRAFHYPFFFFLAVGVLAIRDNRLLLGELYLAIICVVYILGHSLLYLKVRYLLPVVPFGLLWAAQGFLVTVSRANEFCERYVPRLLQNQGPRFLLVTFLCLTAAVTLPKALKPQRIEKLDPKEIGHRIAALSDGRPVVLTSEPQIGFYANAEMVSPPRVHNFEEFLKYVHEKKVDFIVMDKKRVNHWKFGHVVTLFFENSLHPELQLLFTYPSQRQGESPRFYVYRLRGEKNQNVR
jgi:4-amino-4-deoxy-L-arabinose transferase-like glycosyltransferase